MKVQEAIYGNYRLRAGKQGSAFLARAFHSEGARKRGFVAEAEGASSDEALEALKQLLEERNKTRFQARRYISRLEFYVPTTEEFVEALQVASVSPAEQDMLGAHAQAGAHGLTPLQIAQAGGYSSVSNANALYGKLGRKLGEHLQVYPPLALSGNRAVPTGILATYEPVPQGGDVMVWIMHPELREAVAAEWPAPQN